MLKEIVEGILFSNYSIVYGGKKLEKPEMYIVPIMNVSPFSWESTTHCLLCYNGAGLVNIFSSLVGMILSFINRGPWGDTVGGRNFSSWFQCVFLCCVAASGTRGVSSGAHPC